MHQNQLLKKFSLVLHGAHSSIVNVFVPVKGVPAWSFDSSPSEGHSWSIWLNHPNNFFILLYFKCFVPRVIVAPLYILFWLPLTYVSFGSAFRPCDRYWRWWVDTCQFAWLCSSIHVLASSYWVCKHAANLPNCCGRDAQALCTGFLHRQGWRWQIKQLRHLYRLPVRVPLFLVFF